MKKLLLLAAILFSVILYGCHLAEPEEPKKDFYFVTSRPLDSLIVVVPAMNGISKDSTLP
jgi:hypothetical protein